MNASMYSDKVQLGCDILKKEVDGDIQSALEKMAGDYSMTRAGETHEEIFPMIRPNVTKECKKVIRSAFAIPTSLPKGCRKGTCQP